MSSARPLRLCLCGASPDTGNLGVSALCCGALGGLFRCHPDADVTVFDGGHGLRPATAEFAGRSFRYWRCGATGTRRVWQRRSFWNIRVSSWLGSLGNPAVRCLREADAVLDITGGDSFTDMYGPRRFRAGSAFKRLVLALGKPLILLPQTYGPYRDPRHRAIAADIVRRAAMAWARDERSFATLRELLGDAFDPQRHRSGVDVAFALELHAPRASLPDPLATWLNGRGGRTVQLATRYSPLAVPPTPLPSRSTRATRCGEEGLGEGRAIVHHRGTETRREEVHSGGVVQPLSAQGDVGPVPTFPRSHVPTPALVGLNVSGLIWHDPAAMRQRYGFQADYRAVVLGLLRRLLLETDANILLIPHVLTPPGHYESDPAANVAVLAALGDDPDSRLRAAAAERLAAVPPVYDHPSEAKWLIAHCDWFCGTRMHACIAGLSTGVPTAAIAYSVKTQGVFETCGLGDCVVDPRVLDTPAAVAALFAAWSARAAARELLRGHVGAICAQSTAPFGAFTALLAVGTLAAATPPATACSRA